MTFLKLLKSCWCLLAALLAGGLALSARAQPDYAGALWNPAYSGHWYTSGNGHSFLVIHDMEGYYLATISYFQQSSTDADAHFCVNGLKDNSNDSAAGEITQMVREQYYAWHARCWNLYSAGTEHEGFVSNPAWYTEAMYQASSRLQRHLANGYGITKDRNHIIGHNEWQNSSWVNWMNNNFPAMDPTCNDHTDPGQYWDWTHFMWLIVYGFHIDSYAGSETNLTMRLFLPSSSGVTETIAQSSPNGSFGSWSSLGGQAIQGLPAVGYNADRRPEVFARGTDNNLYTIFRQVNGAWSSWLNWGTVNGNASVGYLDDGSMQVFARSSTNTVITKIQQGPNSSWGNWVNLGGACYGDPTVGMNGDGRLQLFMRNSSGALQSNFQQADGTWFGWSGYGGSCVGKPAVANLPDGRLLVFTRSSTNTVLMRAQTSPNGSFGSWTNLAGSCYSDPVVAYNADGRLQLFTRSSSNTVQSNFQLASGAWYGWSDYGGSCYGTLTVGYNADGSLTVFTRNSSNNLQAKKQAGPNGSFGSWTSLGGG